MPHGICVRKRWEKEIEKGGDTVPVVLGSKRKASPAGKAVGCDMRTQLCPRLPVDLLYGPPYSRDLTSPVDTPALCPEQDVGRTSLPRDTTEI